MRRSISLLFFLTIVVGMTAQRSSEPGRHLPKATPAGEGIIDTRVDNMGYWRQMADKGYVYVAPQQNIPSARYTGSEIDSRAVMNVNSTDVPVTGQTSTQSENSVFVKPADSLTVLNSNNSTQNPVGSLYGANYLISGDGGTTWGGSITGAGGSNSGDPTTAISLDNRWYVGFINSNSGQSVAYSTDNGSSWTSVVVANRPPGGSTLLDKNHMWIDNSPASPYEGNLYNAWTSFGGTNDAEIEISRSTNGGLSWSAKTAISTAVAAGSHNQGVNIQTGPNGEVYAIWAIYDSWPTDETAIGMAVSTDGGATFAPATRIIQNIRGIRTTETSKNHRVNSFPSMAVDISGGPNNGNIYIVWANVGVPGINSGSDIDVYMSRSTDGGSTWDTPLRVNQDASGLGKEHYFPWITCDPVTGHLSVIFYDDRNVSSTQCEAYVASSYDGGLNWEDFKVSDVAFTPAPIPGLAGGYMGDYLGISARAGKVYPVWADNRTGTVMSYVSPFEITPEPSTNFAADNTAVCLSDTVIFQDLTLKDPTSWLWTVTPSAHTYVNGTGPASQHPQVRFDSVGNYTVQLITANVHGSDTLIRNDYIMVYDVFPDFLADATTVPVNTSVNFTDASLCSIVTYEWDFGPGATPATALTAGPHNVTYSTTGLKTVTLTVNGSQTAVKTDHINVLSATPCTAGATTCDEYISRVQFAGIDNSSACTPGGYRDYTEHVAVVSPGMAQTLTVTNGRPIYGADQCGTWVDWDQDGTFDLPAEQVAMTGSPGTGPYTASIVPPLDAVKGSTWMRIRVMYTGTLSACGGTQYGEVEDYAIYVGTPGLWKGGAAGQESDWSVAANWDDHRVPDAATNVLVPDNAPYTPELSGNVQCLDLVIEDGQVVTINPGTAITVNGDLNVGSVGGGILVIDAGTATVNGLVNVSQGGSIEVRSGGLLIENN